MVKHVRDYLEELGATIRVSEQGCGIAVMSLGDEHPTGGWFPQIQISELWPALNEAIRVAVVQYTEWVAKAEQKLAPRYILEVSFCVVLSTMTSRWSQSRRLSFETADLCTQRASDCCWNYCERKFGPNHQGVVATLGSTPR